MSDAKKATKAAPAMNASDESAASRLWALYVCEAEKYDKPLVEGWKSDMMGILIFAGLFSISLTAFLIESCKMLTPNSGDYTVLLLAQISQQLAASTNGSTFSAPVAAPFSPAASSLICNVLWLISLGFSLTCALLATLLGQWARDFLRRVDMRSSPVIRARIYSYLYYGLKRFNMHIVVDIVPLLLHASLLFFFGGLVAFLFPINTVIAAVAAALLGVVVAIYSALTLLPFWQFDCPYRTPLSTAVWRVSQSASDLVLDKSATETMVEATSHRAMELSPTRTARDYRALVWTVKSLTDNVELEPFVEALPDLLWAPDGRRYAYEEHIQQLMRQPDLQLLSRIEALLRSCDGGLLTPDGSRRRRITCYKALWAIASVQPPKSSIHPESLDFSRLVDYCQDHDREPDNELLHYSRSTVALLRWSTFCSVRGHLATLLDYLVQCSAEIERGHTPDLYPVTSYLKSSALSHFSFPMDDKLIQYVSDPTPDAASLSILDQAIKTFCTVTPYKILFHYLTHDAVQYSPPYRWEDTRRTISLDDRVPFSAFKGLLETALISAVHHNRDVIATASEAGIWIDTILQTLCDYWRPDEPVPIPDSIIYYLNNRNSKDTLAQLLLVNDFGARLWSSFPITLSPQHSPPQVQRLPFNVGLDEVVQAMWCLAWSGSDTYSATVYEPVLEALEATCKFSPLTFSVTTMIKSRLVNSLLSPYEPLGGPALQHSLLPTETAIPIPPEFLDAKITDNLPDFERVLGNRIGEAKIVLVAEFLEGIRFDFIPYKAIETLHHICATVPEADIHPTHQIRFANAMHHIKMLAMDDRGPGKKLMDSIIESKIFEAYFEAGQPRRHQNAQPGHAWLQDSSARLEVIGILGNYMCSPAIAPRNQAIFTGLRLDSLHPN